MKGKPLYPFGITAVLGIGLIIILSFIGLNVGDDMAGENGENNEAAENFDSPYELGEHVYIGNCAACHGENLDGNPALTGAADRFSQEDIVNIIAEGPGAMPAGLVSGEEAEAVAEYLITETE
ncbi:cytochrome c [Evansella sp. LMS18]|jgi:mono/diheme cytochrome c family protein|uniref:c-type cytochrome n=1 Tax=Evansella sp. LMS18 TaxID=2924033 RepID=UPI0020D06857|nr:cytochrome c [Evansella sp. LMS18]UTR09374.1 cytochrome c [Evansella sp. LMS18]